jgi:hypothetical protein
MNARREIRFYLAPISYLRSESTCVSLATDPTQRIFSYWIYRTLARRGSLRSG